MHRKGIQPQGLVKSPNMYENHSIPPLAQSVEQLPFKEWVVGSNPTGRTNFEDKNLSALASNLLCSRVGFEARSDVGCLDSPRGLGAGYLIFATAK